MRRIAIGATVASAALAASVLGGASAASAADPDTPQPAATGGVALRQDVQAAYDTFAASETAALIQQQGKMAGPNVYLAEVASGEDDTGATPATYWYVRNGLHDDGVSLAPEALLNLNLQNLKSQGAIADVNFQLITNLGHTDNVNTDEAFEWMDGILDEAGPSGATDGPAATGWWDVSTYEGGTLTAAPNGAVSDSSPTGHQTLTVTLDGQPFTLEQYWGWYAATPNSPKQKISITVPQNATADSVTYFRTNNSGWANNPFRTTVLNGAAYTTGALTYNTSGGGGANNPAIIGEVLDRGMIIVDYGARSMNDPANADGQYLGHSPATMTDTKAALRFLKYNQVYGSLPGDPERVIITGMSGGGGLTTAVASSGNSSDYFATLAEIGALGVTASGEGYDNDTAVGDDMFATFSSAPIIDLHKADYANEWIYNPTRQKVWNGEYATATGITNGRNVPDRLADWQEFASTLLAQDAGYPAYIRSLGLDVDTVKRTLLDMVEVALERTVNENESYRPELYDVSTVTDAAQAKEALDVFLRFAVNNPVPGFEALPLDWYTVSGTPGDFEVTIDSAAWDAFNEYTYWSAQFVKGPPASDGGDQGTELGKTNAFYNETFLWGTREQRYNHTNPVSWAVDTLNWPLFGETPSTAADPATRQAENRAIAASLFVTTPVVATAPSISGTLEVGETLTADPGTWTGGGTQQFAYQWLRDGADIPGATGSTLRVSRADQGAEISVRVTATNEAGSASATSAPVTVLETSHLIVTTRPFLFASSSRSVEVRVDVLPRQATGSVSVEVAGKTLTGTLSNGVARVDAGKLPRGVHLITATYAGDGTVAPSSGTGIVIVLR